MFKQVITSKKEPVSRVFFLVCIIKQIRFCIFFIVIGSGGVIILPIVAAFFEISKEKYNYCFDIIWILGATSALLYALIALTYYLKQSVMGKIIYFTIAIVFVIMIFIPIYR